MNDESDRSPVIRQAEALNTETARGNSVKLAVALAKIARGRLDCGRPLAGEEARQIARDALASIGEPW